MPTIFSIQGSSVFLRDPEVVNFHDKLPNEVYSVKAHPITEELLLDRIDSFNIPQKRYGNNDKYAERILHSYEKRNIATGVLLCGEKGSGKSLLAKTLACKAQEKGMPVIVINAPRAGDDFFNMIQRIEQPAVVLFDEFEKVYDMDKQKEVLTLLDGIYPSNKLYVFTVNDKWKLDVNMRNRPGRIFYSIDYKGIEEQFIREYCEDNLNDKSQIDHIVRIKALFSAFNFDMLQALVEEMNRFNEDPFEAIRLLNIKPEYEDSNTYAATISVDGYPDTHISCDREFTGKPMADRIKIYYHKYKRTDIDKDHEDNDSDWISAEFVPTDLVSASKDGKTFVFKNSKGESVKLIAKASTTVFDYRAFAYGEN
jgi:energy-coupling factor transporter ATP-binding protein EcfA2